MPETSGESAARYELFAIDHSACAGITPSARLTSLAPRSALAAKLVGYADRRARRAGEGGALVGYVTTEGVADELPRCVERVLGREIVDVVVLVPIYTNDYAPAVRRITVDSLVGAAALREVDVTSTLGANVGSAVERLGRAGFPTHAATSRFAADVCISTLSGLATGPAFTTSGSSAVALSTAVLDRQRLG